MDNYEYRVKTEQMLGYVKTKNYVQAMIIADSIDWRRVRNVDMLCTVSDIYEKSGKNGKSRDILFLAFDRAPEEKKIVYKLGTLALKLGDVDEAQECLEEFATIAPKDPNRHILRYKILRAQGASVDKQIGALEAFNKSESVERWSYELASLYYEAGMLSECAAQCDDLLLWFGDGKYAKDTVSLKLKFRDLTPSQQEKYLGIPKEKPLAEAQAKLAEEVAPMVEREVSKTQVVMDALITPTPASVQPSTNISNTISPQITGQMRIEEILQGWEETQKEVEVAIEIEKQKAEERARIEALEREQVAKEKPPVQELPEDIRLMMAIEDGEAPDLQYAKSVSREDSEEEVTEAPVEQNVINLDEMGYDDEFESLDDDYEEEFEDESYGDYEEELEDDSYEDYEEELEDDSYDDYEKELEDDSYDDYDEELENESYDEYEEELEDDSYNDYEEELEDDSDDDYEEEEFDEQGEELAEGFEHDADQADSIEIPMDLEPIDLGAVNGNEPEAEDDFENIWSENAIDDLLSKEDALHETENSQEISVEDQEFELKQEGDKLLVLEEEKAAPSRIEMAKAVATGKTAKLPTAEIAKMVAAGGAIGQDTGYIVQARYDLDAQSEVGLRAGLSEEQKKMFSYFVPVRGMSDQLVEVLERDRQCTGRKGTSSTGNLLVIGHKGSGKTVLAVDIVKAIQKNRNIRQGKVAIVTGESLNRKKISDIIGKLYGGALIIEKANQMSEKTIIRLNKAMERETGEMLFILEDERKPLDRLLSSNAEFRQKFTSRLEVPVFINDELVTFGQTYAKENGYKIDEMGILALYSRIDSLQREDHAVSVAEVKEIMDEAIDFSQKMGVKRIAKRLFKRDTEDKSKVVLTEKDFKH